MSSFTKPDYINQLIRSRRSIFPKMYNDQPVDRAIIEQLLENANWAPTHRLTEPWRFKVFTGESLQSLGEFLAASYQATTPEEKFSERKFLKKKKSPQQAAAVIAICMQRDPEERVPEWEEIASVAAAVQNMWLTCTAYGLGSYWSSPKAIEQSGDFLQLKEGERCLGFFYVGAYDPIDLDSPRKPVSDKTQWI
jgi:nitroreductase